MNEYNINYTDSWKEIFKTVPTGWFAFLLPAQILIYMIASSLSQWILLGLIPLILFIIALFRVKNTLVYTFLLFLPLLPILPPTANTATGWALFALLVVTWFFKWISRDFQNQKMPGYVKIFFISFIIIGIFSTLNAFIIQNSIAELIRYTSLAVLLFVLYQLIETKRELLIMLNIILISTCVMVILALPDIMAVSVKEVLSGAIIFQRLESFYKNPNNFAIPFLLSIPIIYSKIIFRQYKGIILNIILFGMLGFFLYVVFLTFSRSAYLCLFISMLFITLSLKIGRRIFLFFTTLFLIILPFIAETLSTLIRLERGLTGRDILWKAAWQMIRNNFLLGVGPGNFESVKVYHILPMDFLSNIVRTEYVSGAAHNLYLTVFSEMGFLCLLSLVGFLILLFVKAWKGLKSATDNESRYLLYVATSVLCGLVVRSFFESGVIIGSGRFGDTIFFLIPVLIIAKSDLLTAKNKKSLS